ncbi:MAG: hypothetical protein ABR520_11520 [Mycobacteriales bacterium]|nr:hypothetical protein [Frankia sp.]
MPSNRRSRRVATKPAPAAKRKKPAAVATQEPSASSAPRCSACDSVAVTELSMTMTNGQVVDFMSCRSCEHKSWRSGGKNLSLNRVLAMAAKRK